MGKWDFPEKLQAFNPVGTRFQQVFEDPVALIVLAQYKRKHIISDKENEWLPRFAICFSQEINLLKKKHSKDTFGFTDKVNLDDAVRIWEKCFAHNPRGCPAGDEFTEKWKAMLEPILPFLNGKKILRLVKEKVPINAKGDWEDQWFLVTELAKETICDGKL